MLKLETVLSLTKVKFAMRLATHQSWPAVVTTEPNTPPLNHTIELTGNIVLGAKLLLV